MLTTSLAANRLAGRATLFVVGVVVASLALTGCTKPPTDAPSTPTSAPSKTPSPTPSQIKQTAPTSDSEAVAEAESVITRFYKIRAQVNAGGGTDPDPLKTVATGPALQIVTDDAGRIATDKNVTSGEITFTPISAYSGDLTDSAGKTYPFSSVQVTGCQDGTNYEIKQSDGTPAQQPTQRKNELQITVIFDPAETTWFVQNLIATGKSC